MSNRWEPRKSSNFAGSLAIASPVLDQTEFARAVLLLMQHTEHGAFGVVLNRPANEQIHRAWAELTAEPASPADDGSGGATGSSETGTPRAADEAPPQLESPAPNPPSASPDSQPKPHLSLGGPLAGPVFALHRRAELGEQQVRAGLYFCASKESLVKLAVEATGPYRIFFGAAGWGPGQLELEVERGIWQMLPATDDVIFCDPHHQWDLAIRRYGRYLWEGLGVRGFPADSQAN